MKNSTYLGRLDAGRIFFSHLVGHGDFWRYVFLMSLRICGLLQIDCEARRGECDVLLAMERSLLLIDFWGVSRFVKFKVILLT